MINFWTDRRLKIDLLVKLRKSGGYSTVKSMPWGYFQTLKDGKGNVIYHAKDYTRSGIINEVVSHYENGTNF